MSSGSSKATNKKVFFNISSGSSLQNGGEAAVEMSPIREVDEKECKYTCSPEAVQIKAPRLTVYSVTARDNAGV